MGTLVRGIKGWRFLVVAGQYNKCMRRVAAIFMNFRRTSLFGAIVSCCVTGCWEEIEYTGPDPAAAQNAETPPVVASLPAESPSEPLAPQTVATDSTNSDASGFADELANSMVSEPTTPAETTVAADGPAPPPEPNLLPFETAEDTSSPPPGSETIASPTEGEPDIRQQANTLSDTVSPAPSKTRLDAWLLGSHLSLAALANDRGVAAESVQKWLDSAKLHAAALAPLSAICPRPGLRAARRIHRASSQLLVSAGSTDWSRAGETARGRPCRPGGSGFEIQSVACAVLTGIGGDRGHLSGDRAGRRRVPSCQPRCGSHCSNCSRLRPIRGRSARLCRIFTQKSSDISHPRWSSSCR